MVITKCNGRSYVIVLLILPLDHLKYKVITLIHLYVTYNGAKGAKEMVHTVISIYLKAMLLPKTINESDIKRVDKAMSIESDCILASNTVLLPVYILFNKLGKSSLVASIYQIIRDLRLSYTVEQCTVDFSELVITNTSMDHFAINYRKSSPIALHVKYFNYYLLIRP